MSDIRFSCTRCGQHIACGDDCAGQQVSCPKCQQDIIVPDAAAAGPIVLPSANLGGQGLDRKTLRVLIICATVLCVVLIMGVCIAIGMSGSNPNDTAVATAGVSGDGQATLQYWKAVAGIIEGSKFSAPDFKLIDNKQFDELSSQCEIAANVSSDLGNRIRVLPVAGVDSDVVDYGLKCADWFIRYANYLSNSAQLSRACKQYQENNESGAAMIESVIRGALGDPLGKYNEAKSDAQRINAVVDRLEQVRKDLVSEIDALESMKANLRARLTQKYRMQF